MSLEVRKLVSDVAKRNAWDPDAIFSLISLETGGSFDPQAGLVSWKPERTATGLLQWTEGTLRLMNVPESSRPPLPRLKQYSGKWRTWNLGSWPVGDQVELVEKYFSRAFEKKKPSRPVDYYLAAWGAAPGISMGTVLAVRGDGIYEQNQVLDVDDDGTIRVSDLARLLHRRMREHGTEKQSEAKNPAAIDVGLTLPGVLVTIGFQVIRRRMLFL